MRSLLRLPALLCLLAGLQALAGCDSQMEPEVTIQDLVVGEGAVAEKGSWVTIHYSGWLQDGTLFDTSREGDNEPLDPFQVGAGRVIKGMDEGVTGMRVGGVRRITIPPELGYGGEGVVDSRTGAVIIPPDATLVFEVELLAVVSPAANR